MTLVLLWSHQLLLQSRCFHNFFVFGSPLSGDVSGCFLDKGMLPHTQDYLDWFMAASASTLDLLTFFVTHAAFDVVAVNNKQPVKWHEVCQTSLTENNDRTPLARLWQSLRAWHTMKVVKIISVSNELLQQWEWLNPHCFPMPWIFYSLRDH